jgi:hypothetical protein
VLAKQMFYHSSSSFCSGYFGDGALQTICPGWPQTVAFQISASQVARIKGTSHQWLARMIFKVDSEHIFIPLKGLCTK